MTKLEMIGIGLLVLVLALVGDYYLGRHIGTVNADAACADLRGTDRADVSRAQTEAVAAAMALQRSYDLQEIAEADKRADDRQQAALEAQRIANLATIRANQLTDVLKRLQNENPSVKTWSDTCLPADLLRGVHGAAPEAAGGPCG